MQEEITEEQLAEIAYDAWCRYCVTQTEAGVLPNEISADDFIARELELVGSIKYKDGIL